jgi:uncharacterized protein
MLAVNFRHALLLTTLVFTAHGHAASFDCAAASSPVEKAVCADPYTSSLDEKLGSLWPSALAKVADPKALKAAQRQWLKNRSLCHEQLACLRREYLQRLVELEYTGKPFNWNATWQRIPATPASAAQITTQRRDDSHITFDITAQEGGNSGDLDGVALLKGSQADYAEGQCTLSFSAVNGLLQVTQNGSDADCGGGMGVYYAGWYVASEQPLRLDFDLLSLGLARSLEENRMLHQLLKADYQVLVDLSGSMLTADPSADVPGSQVAEMWMRGLGGTALYMNAPDGQVWVMLMAYDAQGHSHVRYYTNVPQWKTRLPEAMQAWYARRSGDEALPLDYMP